MEFLSFIIFKKFYLLIFFFFCNIFTKGVLCSCKCQIGREIGFLMIWLAESSSKKENLPFKFIHG